jgi:membrane fusion protein (multidrug efflux system)
MAEEEKSTSQKADENQSGEPKEKQPDQDKQPDKDKGSEKEKKPEKEEKPKKPPLYKRRGFFPIVIIITVVLIVGTLIFWLIARQYVSTDDAYIDGHVTEMSARVAAPVVAMHIVDNQLVHVGNLLIELDPTTFQVALDQAKAQVISAEGKLAQAQAQIGTAKASVTQAEAQVDAARVKFENADKDLKRYQNVDERARSRQQLDNADTTQKSAKAESDQAKAQKVSADADVTSAEASDKAAEGELETSKANEKSAEVNLSYCKIFSPIDGRVTERTVEVGNYVSPGQALFMLVDPNVWVTANFKETQLTHMRAGQPVTIEVDAYPGIKWQGHVDSIQAGSGERFSVLPAENATGNFVKVVQRVPVKIVFDQNANTNDAVVLSPGLSVDPRVKVR